VSSIHKVEAGWRNINTLAANAGNIDLEVKLSNFTMHNVMFLEGPSMRVIAEMQDPFLSSANVWIEGSAYTLVSNSDAVLFQSRDPPIFEGRTIFEMKYMNEHGKHHETNLPYDARDDQIATIKFIDFKTTDANPWLMAVIALVYCIQHQFHRPHG